MTTKCDRCKKDQHYLEKCDGCGRNACKACQKSTRKGGLTGRLVICKDCWTDAKKKKHWENV